MGKKRPGPEQEPPGTEARDPATRPDLLDDAHRILRAPAKPAPPRARNPFKTRDKRKR